MGADLGQRDLAGERDVGGAHDPFEPVVAGRAAVRRVSAGGFAVHGSGEQRGTGIVRFEQRNRKSRSHITRGDGLVAGDTVDEHVGLCDGLVGAEGRALAAEPRRQTGMLGARLLRQNFAQHPR